MDMKRYVLIVDGNYRDLLFTAMVLQNFGYTVTTLNSAEEAVESMSIALPSLIIADGSRCGSAGSDLQRVVRSDPRTAAIPMIVQSAACELTPTDGLTMCLEKPVSAEALYRAVQSAVELTPRQNIRIGVHLKASVRSTGDPSDPHSDEYITVLSEEGAFIRTLNRRPVNSAQTVRFHLHGKTHSRIVTVEAVVLYGASFGDGQVRAPGFGVRFVRIAPEDRKAIQDFISGQVKDGLATVLGE